MGVNLANKDVRGCFSQKCLHLLAGSLPLLSAILTYFQMSVFSVTGVIVREKLPVKNYIWTKRCPYT